MSKFLLNRSAGNVGLVEGRILIPIGGFTEIADEHAEHPDIIDAKRRGWVEILDSAPGDNPAGPGLPPVETENDKLKGSLTPPKKEAAVETPVEEVAEQKEEAPAEEVKPAAKKASK